MAGFNTVFYNFKAAYFFNHPACEYSYDLFIDFGSLRVWVIMGQSNFNRRIGEDLLLACPTLVNMQIASNRRTSRNADEFSIVVIREHITSTPKTTLLESYERAKDFGSLAYPPLLPTITHEEK